MNPTEMKQFLKKLREIEKKEGRRLNIFQRQALVIKMFGGKKE